jgi:hypothetical protein
MINIQGHHIFIYNTGIDIVFFYFLSENVFYTYICLKSHLILSSIRRKNVYLKIRICLSIIGVTKIITIYLEIHGFNFSYYLKKHGTN